MNSNQPSTENDPQHSLHHKYQRIRGTNYCSFKNCGQSEFAKVHSPAKEYNAVEPPHYRNGPIIKGDIGPQITTGNGSYQHELQCIEVMENIQDPRLATAFKYLWRVAFGGKSEPWDARTQSQIDERDLRSAIWYLDRYITQVCASVVEMPANIHNTAAKQPSAYNPIAYQTEGPLPERQQ